MEPLFLSKRDEEFLETVLIFIRIQRKKTKTLFTIFVVAHKLAKMYKHSVKFILI